MSNKGPSRPTPGRNRNATSSSQGGGPSRQPSGQVAKRGQVAAACKSCRSKKTKCDALRPCTPCVSRGFVCQYATQGGETVMQATKRKHNELASRLETYEELFNLIETRDEQDAAETVRWIRSGHSASAIVQFAKMNRYAMDPHKRALRCYLVHLAHSTGSLGQVIKLATSVSSGPISRVKPMHLQEFDVFRNHIVPILYMEELLKAPIIPSRLQPSLLYDPIRPEDNDTQSSTALRHVTLQHDQQLRDMPPHHVPANPWTVLTLDSNAVSHLVSLFLVWINPTWRFVEADLFLQGMRSRDIHSELCSPFLVNSILAIAGLHSENDAAYSDLHRDRITRGQHFHDEAMRLWSLEDNRPSLTSTQALCVLSLESNYRAKDALGLTLVPIAAQFDNSMPIYSSASHCANLGISERDYIRLRINTHWMVRCTYVIMRIAFMNGATPQPCQPEFPKIYDVFDDEVEMWSGYPLTNSTIAHRPTLYLRERCRLAGIFEEVHALILSEGKPHDSTVQGFTSSVHNLLIKMQHWHHRLPFEAQYRWPMSIAIWELHASYLSVSMILRSLARMRLSQEEASSTGQPPLVKTSDQDSSLKTQWVQEHSKELIKLAHTSAQILREFRERYGLKITPAWLLQLQAVAAGILVLDPDLANPIIVSSHEITETPNDRITDSSTAFDEVFRCLLGAGVEVMISRAIARTTYHTALEHKVIMKDETRKLLQIMADTAWRPSDAKLVESSFPNFAKTKGHDDNTERMTEFLRKLDGLGLV